MPWSKKFSRLRSSFAAKFPRGSRQNFPTSKSCTLTVTAKCGAQYHDSHGDKVRDKNAIIAAEYYIGLGMYVVFLHQDDVKRPDLLVDYKLLVEVKGIISLNPGQISKQIKHANSQIESEHSKYPKDKRLPAKIVLISLNESFDVGFNAISEGYKEAKRKDQVHFQTEFWFNEEIRVLDEEELL